MAPVSATSAALPATVTVAAGDTLSAIGARLGINWREIYEANRDQISNPNLIHVGQVFKIPGGGAGDAATGASEAAAAEPAGDPPTEAPPGGAADIDSDAVNAQITATAAAPQVNFSGDPIAALTALAPTSPTGTLSLSTTVTGFPQEIVVPADPASSKIIGAAQDQKAIERELRFRQARIAYFQPLVNDFNQSYESRVGAYEALHQAQTEALQLTRAWQERGTAIVLAFQELQQNLLKEAQEAAALIDPAASGGAVDATGAPTEAAATEVGAEATPAA